MDGTSNCSVIFLALDLCSPVLPLWVCCHMQPFSAVNKLYLILNCWACLFQIKDFMQDFVSNHIIPYMEQKIRVLNQQVCSWKFGISFCSSYHIPTRFSTVLGSANKKGFQKSDQELVVEKERWCPRSFKWTNASDYSRSCYCSLYICNL